MERSKARACAMKLVYEWKMGGDGGEETVTGLLELKPDESEIEFMNGLFEGVKTNEAALTERIRAFLREGWSLERLSKVDLSILLIAVYEMDYTDVGDSVAVNEAVELANTYSTDKAGAFINGVLGSLSRSRDHA